MVVTVPPLVGPDAGAIELQRVQEVCQGEGRGRRRGEGGEGEREGKRERKGEMEREEMREGEDVQREGSNRVLWY